MTLEEAKRRKMDYHYLPIKLSIHDSQYIDEFLDKIYADFDKELDKARREGYVAGGNDCFILLTGKDK